MNLEWTLFYYRVSCRERWRSGVVLHVSAQLHCCVGEYPVGQEAHFPLLSGTVVVFGYLVEVRDDALH